MSGEAVMDVPQDDEDMMDNEDAQLAAAIAASLADQQKAVRQAPDEVQSAQQPEMEEEPEASPGM
jgi:hypothetical protein